MSQLQTRVAAHDASSSVPRITVPHRMVKRMERVHAKNQVAKHRLPQYGRKGELVIACKRSQFNHYVGQRYNDLTIRSLASGGWKHTESKSDYFTINAVYSVGENFSQNLKNLL